MPANIRTLLSCCILLLIQRLVFVQLRYTITCQHWRTSSKFLLPTCSITQRYAFVSHITVSARTELPNNGTVVITSRCFRPRTEQTSRGSWLQLHYFVKPTTHCQLSSSAVY